MPKIAQYEPGQVASQVVAQPRARSAPAGAFDGITQGLSALAAAGVDMKKRVDTTSAEEALVGFERDKNDVFFNPESGYFNSQGRNAYDGSTATSKALDDLKKKYGENLNSESKAMFDRAAGAHITRGQQDIARHASKGLKAWEIATIESQVENTIENATLYWNSPDLLRVQRVLGEQAVTDASEMAGIGAEATAEKLQTFRSSFAGSIVEAATQSSAAEGQEALEKHGDQLEGPDRVDMKDKIEKKEKAEKTQADATAAIITAQGLVDRYDNRGDIIEEVNKIKDVDLRKKTMSEAMTQHSRKRSAEAELRGDSFEAAETVILDGGTAEQYKADDPEGWESMSRKQQRALEGVTTASTDWSAFSDLMLLPKSELAKINPSDHFHKLAKGERGKLITAVKAANGKASASERTDHQAGRTRTSQTTSAVTQLFGKKTTRGKDRIAQADNFYSMLDEEVNARESAKGSKLTSEEFTNVLAGFTRTVVEEGVIWDTELDISDIPADDAKVISRYLIDKGIPVTSDNLIKAYRQASE